MKSWHLQSLSLLLLVFAYKSNAEETASICDEGRIIPKTQACFKVTEYYRSSREKAESDCNELEGNLASIPSERAQTVAEEYIKKEEEKRIRSAYYSIHNSSPSNDKELLSLMGVKYNLPYWIGAKSNETGIFWSDGTKVVYHKFYGKVEHNKCSAIWNAKNGSWFFAACKGIWPIRALCEIHFTTTPRPTTRPQPPTTTPPPSCPESWRKGGYPTSCHLLFQPEQGLDWYQAARKCEVFGAKLANITSEEENDFAQWLMDDYDIEEVWVSPIFQVPTGSSSNGNTLEISGDGKCLMMTRGGKLKTKQCNVIIGGAVCQKIP